jgi:hypothetical protein
MWCFDAGVVYPSLNSRIIPCLTCRTECTVTSIQFLSTNPLSYHIQPSMHQHLSFDTTLDYSQSKPRDKKRGNKRQEERNEQQREERTKRGKDEEMKGRREERTKRETRRTAHTHLHAIQHSNEPPTHLPTTLHLPNPAQHPTPLPSFQNQRRCHKTQLQLDTSRLDKNKRQCGSATRSLQPDVDGIARAGRWVVVRATRRGKGSSAMAAVWMPGRVEMACHRMRGI